MEALSEATLDASSDSLSFLISHPDASTSPWQMRVRMAKTTNFCQHASGTSCFEAGQWGEIQEWLLCFNLAALLALAYSEAQFEAYQLSLKINDLLLLGFWQHINLLGRQIHDLTQESCNSKSNLEYRDFWTLVFLWVILRWVEHLLSSLRCKQSQRLDLQLSTEKGSLFCLQNWTKMYSNLGLDILHTPYFWICKLSSRMEV